MACAEELAVGVNDLLELRVTIWHATDGVIEDLPSVSGEYTVGSGGSISVPPVGLIDVEGSTPKEISAKLQDAMTAYSQVGQSPRVAVSVERYAPIYIVGEVNQPGAYDFVPGLTVLKALAIAGGVSQDQTSDWQERNYLTAQGTARGLLKELSFLEVRQDRLIAETHNSQKLFDAEGPTDKEVTAIRKTEAEIFAARIDRYTKQQSFLENAEKTLREAIVVMEQKLETNELQLAAARDELARAEMMVERGVVPEARLFDRVRYVGDVESRVLDIERAILLSRQDLQQVEEQRLLLASNRTETAVTELQQVRSEIAETQAKLETQYALMSEALGAQVEANMLDQLRASEPVITIDRDRIDEVHAFRAERDAKLLPGDVIEVRFPDAITPFN